MKKVVEKIEQIHPAFYILAIVAVALGLLFFKGGEEKLGALGGNNLITNTTQITTSTNASALPVKLLSRNYSRAYCAIVNDSDTAVYLTFKNFTDASAASTSVGAAKGGLRLNANGGIFECTPEKMVVTDIWASSTASGKNILVTEQ